MLIKFQLSISYLVFTALISVIAEYSESGAVNLPDPKEFCIPGPIENGIWIQSTKALSLNKIKIPLGDSIAIKCISGYTLTHDKRREKVCLKNGKWQPSEDPVCTKKNENTLERRKRKAWRRHGRLKYYPYRYHVANRSLGESDRIDNSTAGPLSTPDAEYESGVAGDAEDGGYEYIEGEDYLQPNRSESHPSSKEEIDKNSKGNTIPLKQKSAENPDFNSINAVPAAISCYKQFYCVFSILFCMALM